ncbi:probable FeS assembly SUF system protein SufT [gamma proteobacterium HTCC5015]|nr:probable FeS assembly SUF system protein SufT [gamma proteobacterium HTCC5015]
MQERETIITQRAVAARLVPAGTEIEIPNETFVTLTQSLGGSFTVSVNGNLARIEGKDADALGKEPPKSDLTPNEDGTINEEQVWQMLHTCFDPEIPVDIVELGLIYDCQIINDGDNGNEVFILMTLTAPGCGMGPVIADEVKYKTESIPNVDKATVELTFDPPWDYGRLSDTAKLELGMM